MIQYFCQVFVQVCKFLFVWRGGGGGRQHGPGGRQEQEGQATPQGAKG